MGLFEAIIFMFLAILCLALSIYFLREEKSNKSILFAIGVLPLMYFCCINWRLALIDSGKNPAWLGFERYSSVVITFILIVIAALVCIAVNVRKKHN